MNILNWTKTKDSHSNVKTLTLLTYVEDSVFVPQHRHLCN